jgi:ribosomal protein S7
MLITKERSKKDKFKDLSLNPLTKFRNFLIKDGRKKTADKLLYQLLIKIKNENGNKHTLFLFLNALRTVMPSLEFRNIHKGATIITIPFPLTFRKSLSFAIRSIIKNASQRKERGIIIKIFEEIRDILNLRGVSVEQKFNNIKTGIRYKYNAHYRWTLTRIRYRKLKVRKNA